MDFCARNGKVHIRSGEEVNELVVCSSSIHVRFVFDELGFPYLDCIQLRIISDDDVYVSILVLPMSKHSGRYTPQP